MGSAPGGFKAATGGAMPKGVGAVTSAPMTKKIQANPVGMPATPKLTKAFGGLGQGYQLAGKDNGPALPPPINWAALAPPPAPPPVVGNGKGKGKGGNTTAKYLGTHRLPAGAQISGGGYHAPLSTGKLRGSDYFHKSGSSQIFPGSPRGDSWRSNDNNRKAGRNKLAKTMKGGKKKTSKNRDLRGGDRW